MTANAPFAPSGDGQEVVQVGARRDVTRRLGEWTTAASFDVRVSSGVAVLDLVLPRTDADEVSVHLDVDGGLVTLLVPGGSRVIDEELRWAGPRHLRDRTGGESPDGRVVRLAGQVRWGDVRIRRGGVALLSLIRHGKAADVQRAYAEGHLIGKGAAT